MRLQFDINNFPDYEFSLSNPLNLTSPTANFTPLARPYRDEKSHGIFSSMDNIGQTAGERYNIFYFLNALLGKEYYMFKNLILD